MGSLLVFLVMPRFVLVCCLSVCMKGQQGTNKSKEEQQTQKYFLGKIITLGNSASKQEKYTIFDMINYRFPTY